MISTAKEGELVFEIKERDLHEIEFLLNQSTRGHHLLFDTERVAHILKTPTEELDFFKHNNLLRIQHLLSKLTAKKSLRDKKDYISSLDNEAFEILVRTYFHIVDNAILSSASTSH